MAHEVKSPPAVKETRVQSLGQEEALEEEMATHPTVPAWRMPESEKPGRLQSMGSQKESATTATGRMDGWR